MLEHFFGSKTRLKLLQLFFRFPEQNFFVRELARLTEIQLHAIRRELANLARLDIIIEVPQADLPADKMGTERSKYYRLNQDALLFAELRALLIKAKIVEEKELIATLKDKAGKLTLFMLTGVFMQEKDASTDILLVGTVRPQVVAKFVKAYEKETGEELRYTVMTDKEFMERRELGDKFLYSLFEGKHSMVVNSYTSVN